MKHSDLCKLTLLIAGCNHDSSEDGPHPLPYGNIMEISAFIACLPAQQAPALSLAAGYTELVGITDTSRIFSKITAASQRRQQLLR